MARHHTTEERIRWAEHRLRVEREKLQHAGIAPGLTDQLRRNVGLARAALANLRAQLAEEEAE